MLNWWCITWPVDFKGIMQRVLKYEQFTGTLIRIFTKSNDTSVFRYTRLIDFFAITPLVLVMVCNIDVKCTLLWCRHLYTWLLLHYRGANKSLTRPGMKQSNVSVRMVWISFAVLPCKKKRTWSQLASRCCWNRACPWHASELASFLVGLRPYQHPGTFNNVRIRISYIKSRLTVYSVGCVASVIQVNTLPTRHVRILNL